LECRRRFQFFVLQPVHFHTAVALAFSSPPRQAGLSPAITHLTSQPQKPTLPTPQLFRSTWRLWQLPHARRKASKITQAKAPSGAWVSCFHTSRAAILIVMQSMHRMVLPDANKPPAGARGPRSRRASCVSAPTRFSNERIDGTWHGVTGESQIRPPSRLHIPSRNSCAKTYMSRVESSPSRSCFCSCGIAAISGTDMDHARLTTMQGLRNQVSNPRSQGRH
jgi:hypothetical protein